MTETRENTAHAAADALARIARPSPALIGFDGFIDSIIHLVDTRHDMTPDGYTRLATIPAFAARCAAASGRSTNIEQVLIENRFGGNGPLLASSLSRLGCPVTYIGAVGDGTGGVHPVFRSFADRCHRVIPTGPPSYTHCLEFEDGKLMLNNTRDVQRVTWEHVLATTGDELLHRLVDESPLLGIVNWSLLGGVPGIWRGFLRDILPSVSPSPRRLFIDLSDPAKRTDADIADALLLLRELEDAPGLSVTLGLNLAESQRIARVLNARAFDDQSMATQSGAVTHAARAIREASNLSCVVIHPREGAAAADDTGNAAWFDGPFTPTPRLSTGAGDHFNGGFAFAQTHGLALDQCLAVGCAVSGAYVRDAESPTRERIESFLHDLPGAGE
ncbi:MAG: hypothetical protein JNK25_11580 [Phycisphaerae bacterium]|nr:hypothetical protein [Phycisphaerae bacterium]